jgi:hypothetical protein
MKLLTPKCHWGSCPAIYDMDDGSNRLGIIGERGSTRYPGVLAIHEEFIFIDEKLLNQAGYYKVSKEDE